jgi:hypothetical protein
VLAPAGHDREEADAHSSLHVSAPLQICSHSFNAQPTHTHTISLHTPYTHAPHIHCSLPAVEQHPGRRQTRSTPTSTAHTRHRKAGSGCTYIPNLHQDYQGSDIGECGTHGSTAAEIEVACASDPSCAGFSLHDIGNGFEPWCMKSGLTNNRTAEDHTFYVKGECESTTTTTTTVVAPEPSTIITNMTANRSMHVGVKRFRWDQPLACPTWRSVIRLCCWRPQCGLQSSGFVLERG